MKRGFTRRDAFPYLAALLGLFLVLVLGLAAFNYCVDAEWFFEHSPDSWLKDRRIGNSREAKARLPARFPMALPVLGSSKTDFGIDPGSALLAPKNLINLGLSSTSMSELYDYSLIIRRDSKAREIVILLDAGMLHIERRAGAVAGGFEMIGAHFFGQPATTANYRLLKSLAKGVPPEPGVARGLYPSAAASSGVVTGTWETFENGARVAKFLTREAHRAGRDESQEAALHALKVKLDRLERDNTALLSQMVTGLLKDGWTVNLCVSPQHAIQYEIERLLRMQYPTDAKEDVAWAGTAILRSLLALKAADPRGDRLLLWWVPPYAKGTTVALPRQGANAFWAEAQHFKPTSGDAIVGRILGLQKSEGWDIEPIPDEKRLEEVLSLSEQWRQQYRRERSDDISRMERVLSENRL